MLITCQRESTQNINFRKMRALFEIKISDSVLQKHGYTQEDVVELTKKMIDNYWFDEGIDFDDENDSETCLNIYQ